MAGGSESSSSGSNGKPHRHAQSVVIITIAIVAVFVFMFVATEEKSLMGFSEKDHLRTGEGHAHVNSLLPEANELCTDVCHQRWVSRLEVANLLKRSELVLHVEAAKKRLLRKLEDAYGEYFEPIFVDKETGNYRPFQPVSDDSMERLKRKLKIKVLSMQLAFEYYKEDFKGCLCSGGDAGHAMSDDVLETLDADDLEVVLEGIGVTPDMYEKYVWATGGHSASAGHGNLYNETYTAYMEDDLKNIFGSIGIDFVGRNYAMGGTASATMMSMCHKEVFGNDIDFFSWDYGMTDGGSSFRCFHYTYRGAMSPSRPAVMLIHYGGRNGPARLGPVQELETNGLAAFIQDNNAEKEMKAAFPDSAGISMEELNNLPELTRNYKCGTSIEKGDPFCGAEKFSKWGGCPKRDKQTSWHPGFKDHALDGHGLALFLTEALLSAVRELDEHEEQDKKTLLEQLRQEDIELHTNFLKADLPEIHKKVVDLHLVKAGSNESSIDESIFTRGPTMCHTARLPAQTRYLGILTETNMVGGPAPPGEETYDVGLDFKANQKIAKPEGSDEMRLVHKKGDEEKRCPGFTVKPDYPDSFFVNSLDGWTKLTFPNAAEQHAYHYDPKAHEGLIVFHLRKCDWGKCPKEFLTTAHYSTKDWVMKINGQKVTEVIDIGEFATIAKGKDGFRFQPDANGQYTIEVKVNADKMYTEFADFVLY